MKSSAPVFTRKNPFQPASRVGKTHYHPSRNQALSKRKRKEATLSPVRSNQRSSPQIQRRSPESHDHYFADEQPVFAESWPSTSPGSTTTSSDVESSKQFERARKGTVSSELGGQQDSVLAKYIERFRHGEPQSREERQQMTSAAEDERLPFWWMSSSSLPPSSTPTKATDKDDNHPAVCSPAGQHQRDRSLSLCRGSLSMLSDISQGEFDDTELLQLQERASRLLLKGECALSDGSIPVSSEGVGSSDFSPPVSLDEPMRRPWIPSLLKSATVKTRSDPVQAVSSQKFILPPLVTSTRPEEDILFQWRLRRKMEQARERPQSFQHYSLHGATFNLQPPSLSHPSASGQAYKSTQPPEFSQKPPEPKTTEAPGPGPPASDPPPSPAYVVSGASISQPQTIAHVPAHMHFLCDVLPCPIQSSHAIKQHNISQTLDESQARVCKKTEVPGNTIDEPTHDHVSSSPPASSGSGGREWPRHLKSSERNKKKEAQTKESEKNEKKTASSIKKQNKLTRYTMDPNCSDGHHPTNRSSSHQRPPKKVKPWAEQHQTQSSQEFLSQSCTGDHATPSSPVHSALGQVVSEVLFPKADSSPAQRTPVSLVPPPCSSSARPQSPVPPSNAQNSVEVISQLLQEAEDSDEKEFEDDPLLQVLRKQRKWVKEQIREVESLLNEFLQVT